LRYGVDKEFHQYVGNGIYALASSYGGVNGNQHMLALVYHSKVHNTYNIDENPSWIASSAGDRVRYMSQKLEESGLGQIQEMKTILDASERVFDLGVKDRFFPLNKWSSDSGRILLAGDSAHPM
jgi:hypothetical protein